MRWLFAVALVACACPSKQTGTQTTTGGSGSASGSGAGPATATGCDGVSAKIQALYRAEAQGAEKGGNDPARVAEAVADNTAMVMAACAKAPPTVSACIAGVTTVKDLEAQCLPRLDEEGSEADVLVR